MSFLLCFLLVAAAWAAPDEFEVTSLPGWDGPLPSKMYSGFSSAGASPGPTSNGTMYFHYVFIESENDPATDPVVVWYNVSLYDYFVAVFPVVGTNSQCTVMFEGWSGGLITLWVACGRLTLFF
jgi:hypothetical protein